MLIANGGFLVSAISHSAKQVQDSFPYLGHFHRELLAKCGSAVVGFGNDSENLICTQAACVRHHVLDSNGLHYSNEFVAIGDADGRHMLRNSRDARVHSRPDEEVTLPDDMLDLALIVIVLNPTQPIPIAVPQFLVNAPACVYVAFGVQ